MTDKVGSLYWITESVVRARIDGPLTLAEQVWVGEERLTAEVIALKPDLATIQVYEETGGLHVGDPVFGSGRPLSVRLGPGILGQTFDGIQRPLDMLQQRTGIFIRRGENVSPLDPNQRWQFMPKVEEGQDVGPGEVLGVVPETSLVDHRILVPPEIGGKLVHLASEGEYTVEDEIAVVETADEKEQPLTMAHSWPVRRPRPVQERLRPTLPLITGQRILDTFFPITKGGTAAVPGPFGSGKTVLQHSLAKWSDADIIVYVGCGERGNEMAQVLEDFPQLEDPASGKPLMERTVLIANTSNMPVAAREASIYTGITLAEYYRDQGYDVALMADSTSRWAEALREISGRLEEMPAEEGFPAYLPSRLAAFYERAGRIKTIGDRTGSVTAIAAVSPPGGDFSEPVTRNTQRFTQTWWALDRDLAHQRHYPSVGWLKSYSLYLENVADWWNEQADYDWPDLRHQAMTLLQEEAGLQQLVDLVGPDALAEPQRWTLMGARLLREGFLQQNAFHEIDAYAVPEKQIKQLAFFIQLYRKGQALLEDGVPLKRLQDNLDMPNLIRIKNNVPNDDTGQIQDMQEKTLQKLDGLAEKQ